MPPGRTGKAPFLRTAGPPLAKGCGQGPPDQKKTDTPKAGRRSEVAARAGLDYVKVPRDTEAFVRAHTRTKAAPDGARRVRLPSIESAHPPVTIPQS